MNILGIETSCDETAAAIVQDGKTILTSSIASSAEVHRKYGGVVPEVAARKQVEYMIPTLTEALQGFTKDDIDAIAVTVGPGLIGSLLVGVETAKTLAFAWNKPIIPVNHVLAHIYANFVDSGKSITFPAICLVVSGGHTELYLMSDTKTLKWLGGTTDDAAGEAFDKTARLLGFENRGGVAIAEAAARHSERSEESRLKAVKIDASLDASLSAQHDLKLPRPMMDGTLNFSFSGLKTAVMREWNKHSDRHSGDRRDSRIRSWTSQDDGLINMFSYEIQEAITDVLVKKTLHAAKMHNAQSILVSGGVAANERLREKLMQKNNTDISIHFPPPNLCTDNAVSIAAYAYYQNLPVPWKNVTAQPSLSVEIK